VLRAGRIEQIGAPLELYNHPANRFVAGFIGSPQMNFVGGRIEALTDGGARVALDAGPEAVSPPIPVVGSVAAGDRIQVGIRPEHMMLDRNDDAALEVPAAIERVEQLGTASFVYARTPGGEPLTVHVAGQRAFRAGETIVARLPIDRLHLFDASDAGRTITQRDVSASDATAR
jgi:multiple sugar transport system ATP-binding protein